MKIHIALISLHFLLGWALIQGNELAVFFGWFAIAEGALYLLVIAIKKYQNSAPFPK